MTVLYIRGVSKTSKLKLQEKADAAEFPSLNAYIVYQLEKIAQYDGLTEQEIQLRNMNKEAVEVLKENTEVLLNVIGHFKKGEF
ncbi:hypothetical protein NHG25_05945 [Aerococcaceae bacterium NML191292]|nr:hypothetical protein [Aerococcaceae bacterium NML191292]MCW6681866.1 hypothetical protein [Aerococcaceae bacterium NML160702]